MRLLLLLLILMLTLRFDADAQQVTDTMYVVRLHEVMITDTRQWASDKERYQFNQTRHYVEMILPYLQAATKIFREMDAAIKQPGSSKKEKRRLIQAKEMQVRERFEDDVKKLNDTQGALLMKLIARQTGVNVYSMLQEFKNPLTAVKWQAWARVHGFNLNKKYQPEDEPLLEAVMQSLGYPLPDFYQQ